MPFLGDTDSHSYLILTVSKFFLKQVLLTIGVHLARTNAAVHWCWVTAHLSEQQIFIGANAVTQGCCEPVLQSSTELCGVHLARTNAAVHWCWVTAHLSEQQIFTGAVAVTQGCCEPVLQSSTEQRVVHLARTDAAVHCCWVRRLL